MTRKHSTKRTLIASILVLCLCLTSFIGTTFAWFTDSVTSANNIIKSGTLDVEMSWADGKADPASATFTDASAGPIFNYDNWEPGYAEARHVKIANVGTLALKYSIRIIPDGEVSKLADVIDVYYADPAVQADRTLAGLTKLGTLTDVLSNIGATANGTLEAGKNDSITLVLKMQESAGNEYQNMSIGSSFSVQLVATQLTAEKDSFGDDYDADATYPAYVNVTQNVATDSNNKSTAQVTISYEENDSDGSATTISKADVIVPAGAQLEDDATQITLKIKELENVNADVATQITSDQTATTYEISLEGLAETNDQDIEVSLVIAKGLVDVQLYHKGTLIPCEYDASTGELTFTTKSFSPFTVVSATKVFEEGRGTKENPYIIKTADDMLNISKYYHEYKYYKVADGVETLDLNGIGNISLNGSFDGNNVKIVNLTTSLFQVVGIPCEKAEMKIYNMDVTICATNGRALVRNIYNAGETIFENVSVHGYIEGQYNIGSFYNYGTANSGISEGSDYTVSFINAKSDATLVCTTGNVIGGMLGHGYEGADFKLSINMDENSGYTGNMYTTNGATCYQIMALCSHATYVLNGVETSRTANTYSSTKLTVVAPTAGADGYYVAPVEGVASYVVSLNAQITAYDANGNKIANKAGLTGNLGSTTVAEGFDGKLFDLVKSAKIVNGLNHSYSYEMNDGELTVYTGKSSNYASGWITLQVNQYDAEGNLLATGSIRVYEIKEVSTADKLVNAIKNGYDVVLTNDIELTSTITVATGQNVVIDLNGHTISGTCNANQGYLFMVNNGAKLTVLDSSEAQTGKITFAQGTSNVGWAIDLEGELVLESGTIELTGDSWSIGYCVDVRPNAWGTAYTNPTVFTMNGGKVVSSDGAIRVASSSSHTYTGVSAKFVMNGGEVEAAWDGIFLQQSDAVYDILTVELNGGKVASALSPVRVYGPVATSVVGGAEKPMTLKIGANAELSVIGEIDTSRTWYVEGVVVLGGGMTVEALEQYTTITIAE